MGAVLGTPIAAGGGMAAIVYLRGGSVQIAAPSIISAAKWSRVLDGTSDAEVVIPAAGNRCSEFRSVEPWAYELAIYRNGLRVWEGPISRVVDSRARRSIVITARDHTAWLERRICMGYDSTGSQEDIADTAAKMLRAALAADDPNVRRHIAIVPTGISVERAVEPNSTYAYTDLKALAGLGLNFTAVGRRIVLFGENRALSKFRRLTDNHFTGELPLVTTDKATTRATLVGDGVVGTFGSISARYGLLEQLGREDGVLEERSLIRGAKARVNGRPPTVIDGGQPGALKKSAPVIIADLVPGAMGEISVRGNCRTVLQLMRLEQLNVTWSPGKEAVQPVFAPLNDYSEVGA